MTNLLYISLVLFNFSLAFSQLPKPTFLVVNENTVDQSTSSHIKIFEEVTPITIDQISHPDFQQNFKPLQEVLDNGTFNNKAKIHWLKLRIKNKASSDEPYKLSIPFSDNITLYLPSGYRNYIGKENGELFPYDEREVPVGKMIFMNMLIPTDGVYSFYIRLGSETAISQQFRETTVKSLKLYSDKGFRDRFEKNRIFEALFYGALIIMMIYNFFIFISLKNRSYLYYVLYLFMLLVFLSANSGYLFELLTGNIPLADLYLRFLATPAMLFLFVLFGRNFLNSNKFAPKLDFVLKILQGLFVICAFIMLFQYWYIGRQLIIISAIITYLIVLYTSIICWKNGYSPARYFLAANLLVLLGGIIYAMERIAVIVQNPLTHYGVQISVALEVALFSIGLADRINLVQKQLAAQTLAKERLEKEQEMERKKIIEEKNKELEVKVIERTAEVVAQKEEIEHKNKSITDSIKYAKKIQKAILGAQEIIIENIRNSYNREAFILFKPRDIVSGDFYWFEDLSLRLGDKKISKKIIIAADCTGHGVPGAFMTVMGHALLNEIINDLNITEPADILAELDKKVKATLIKQEGSYSANDGMDMSIICIDDQNNEITFAGANNPLYHVVNNQQGEKGIKRIKGSKFPVGSSQYKVKEFQQHHFKINKGDLFYIFSDGFQDQFGGDLNRKFMSKRFREYLFNISHLPLDQQEVKLDREFIEWKKDYPQTDDVLVIGLKF